MICKYQIVYQKIMKMIKHPKNCGPKNYTSAAESNNVSFRTLKLIYRTFENGKHVFRRCRVNYSTFSPLMVRI